MKQPGLILLCGRNSRSSAYVQALAYAGIEPEAVIIYGSENSKIQTRRQLKPAKQDSELFCPDLTVDVQGSVEQFGWNLYLCPEMELDSDKMQSLLERLKPRLLVYSGYGGQIVPTLILQKTQVLHIHSGELPRYRGSTTIYYEILEHQGCAASAILLEPRIDTGPVLLSCHYPLPAAGLDIDYLYDNQIRADLLVKVLSFLQQQGCLPERVVQNAEMAPYYIIHPVLKHLALLAVDAGVQADGR